MPHHRFAKSSMTNAVLSAPTTVTEEARGRYGTGGESNPQGLNPQGLNPYESVGGRVG